MKSISFEGIIVKSTGGLYTVEKSDGTREECRAKGSFRHSRVTPLAGDRVVFEKDEGKEGFIVEIKERKNSLIRPAAANIDLLMVVVAAKNPDPDFFILDKLTAVARNNGIDTVLIVNKCDLDDGNELIDVYTDAGFTVIPMCAVDKDGYAESICRIRSLAKGHLSFFTGASGVGKSSVINAVFPEIDANLETGEISRKIQRGKHTTRVTTLFKIDEDTYIGDTPGFSMLDVSGFRMIDVEALLSTFPDIEKYAFDCKYKKCTHVCEDGCGVMAALDEGKIRKTRHQSYKMLYDELKEIKPWDK